MYLNVIRINYDSDEDPFYNAIVDMKEIAGISEYRLGNGYGDMGTEILFRNGEKWILKNKLKSIIDERNRLYTKRNH